MCPEDPHNPLNWNNSRKWVNVIYINQGMLSPITASIVAVGSLDIAHNFRLPSIYTPNLPVGMYVLGLGLGPLCLAALSELQGRRIVYLVSFFPFTIINVGCALASNITASSISRLLPGICGSVGPALGGASIGDIFLRKDRGKAQVLYALGSTVGPIIGPLVGAFVVNRTHNWRLLMWIMVNAFGVTVGVSTLLLRETYAPFLLTNRQEDCRKR